MRGKVPKIIANSQIFIYNNYFDFKSGMMKKNQEEISQINLKKTLSRICELTNFMYGEVWLPNPEKNLLELSPIYHIPTSNHKDDLEKFRLCSQDLILFKGEGLPGRVWLAQQPEWMLDVSAESERYFLRNLIAKAFGVRTGFAIPLIVEEKVLMILAFFACKIRSDSSDCLALTLAACQQENMCLSIR